MGVSLTKLPLAAVTVLDGLKAAWEVGGASTGAATARPAGD